MATTVARTSKSSEDGYRAKTIPYYIPLIIVFLAWGLVPSFAEKAGLDGQMTTLWVNWTALPAVAILITVLGKWHTFKQYSVKSYVAMGLLGLIWPLAYSIGYFGSVVNNGSAMTSILNNTWPIFYLISAAVICPYVLKGRKVLPSVIAIFTAVAGVLWVLYIDSGQTFSFAPVIFLGLFAAMTQGFYSAATDRWEYDPWVMTFVIEAVTCIGVTVMVIYNGGFSWPSWSALGYLSIVGAVSNGLGFWAFLSGSQVSGKLGLQQKTTWLVGMCLIPFAQVLIALATGLTVKPIHWWGIGIVVAALLFNGLSKLKK
jgi:drug/metabolite transporter (DMT)-like permease